MFGNKGEHIVIVNDSMGLCQGGKKVIFKARLDNPRVELEHGLWLSWNFLSYRASSSVMVS